MKSFNHLQIFLPFDKTFLNVKPFFFPLADIVVDDDIDGETMLGHGRAGLIHSTQSAPEAHKYVNMGLQPMPLPQKLGQRAVAGRIRSGGLKVIYLYYKLLYLVIF